MLQQAENACFLIADISGYTGFIAGVELDHAQDIIADLMDTVLNQLRPPFRLAKFEGDAIFAFAIGSTFDGNLIQDAIEASYFAFRRRLRNISQSTTCECKACAGMRHLDLKFVCHHGAFIRQKMGGREELAGRDIILLHRLLKNDAKERLGDRAYALLTHSALQAMGVDPAAHGMIKCDQSIDIIGDVECWLRDLEGVWQSENERSRHEVTRENSLMVLEFGFAVPRPVVWEYFTSPGQRPKWRAAEEVREAVRDSRRGVGTVNHCMHGAAAVIEEILDWRPFDYLTLTTLLPAPGAPKIPMTYRFSEDADGATTVEIRIAKPKPKDKEFLTRVAETFREHITHEVDALRLLIKVQNSGATVNEEPEPTLPASQRFSNGHNQSSPQSLSSTAGSDT